MKKHQKHQLINTYSKMRLWVMLFNDSDMVETPHLACMCLKNIREYKCVVIGPTPPLTSSEVLYLSSLLRDNR